jgi:hypothetical protein
MKKKPQKRKTQSNRKRFNQFVQQHPWRFIFIGLAAIVVIYCATSGSVYYLRTQQEKVQFSQAQTDLSELYQEVVSKAGEPYGSESESYCHRKSAEFGGGFRTCSVASYATYNVATNTDRKMKAQEIFAVIKNARRVSNFKLANYNPGLSDQTLLSASNFHLGGFEHCSVAVYLTDSSLPTNYPNIDIPVDGGIAFDMGCSKAALKDYFPSK